MAIGSGGEAGVRFGLWKDMSADARRRWWDFMRTNWQPLMNGYAKTVHKIKENPYYDGGKNE